MVVTREHAIKDAKNWSRIDAIIVVDAICVCCKWIITVLGSITASDFITTSTSSVCSSIHLWRLILSTLLPSRLFIQFYRGMKCHMVRLSLSRRPMGYLVFLVFWWLAFSYSIFGLFITRIRLLNTVKISQKKKVHISIQHWLTLRRVWAQTFFYGCYHATGT